MPRSQTKRRTQPRDTGNPRPRWDAVRRELWFRGQLVKRFRVPSANQTIVLDAFEADGWPQRIDDPLPGVTGIVAKHRLHDTIKALNHKQKDGCMRFRGDGTGEGIFWEPCEPA